MKTRSVFFLCLVFVSAGGSLLAEEPAPVVPVVRVVSRDWTDAEDFTGRTEAAARVELRSRVSGYLIKTLVQEGSQVKQGDLLFEIDPRIYRGELDRAEATLKLAEARRKLAEANYQRAKALLDAKDIGPEEMDRAMAEREVTTAEVRAAQASREIARLHLDFTRIQAPCDGRIGKPNLDPGNLVKADETILATLVRSDPLYVYFDVDERTVLRLRRSLKEDSGKAEKVSVAVGLADEEGFPRRGVLDFTDNQLNPDTGTLRLRAMLPNKDGLLLPGLFVRVRLPFGAPHPVLVVPERAVMAQEGQHFVYVVNDKNVIEQRAVRVGQIEDGLRLVTRGLQADERVVVGRLQALQPGMAVRPREEKKPASKEKPAPESIPESAAPPLRRHGGTGVVVEAFYPGAHAETVSEAVRSPIEQQINGVEKLRSMRSRCTHDGKYALALSFGSGVDLKVMQVLVQNRVNLAFPTLPDAVKTSGVLVKRGTSGAVMIVHLFAPDGERGALELSNYANLQLKDELARVPGVGDVTLLGHADYGLRIYMDPDRLAALGLSAADVTQAIKKHKDQGDEDAEKFGNIIVKADGAGPVVRLKDVARLEFGAGAEQSRASCNGKPAVALVVRATGEIAPRMVRAGLRDVLSQLRQRLPRGLELAVAFDFTTDAEFLLLDVDLPPAASAERVWQMLNHCQSLLRPLAEVRDVLALSENPFDVFGGGPCLLVSLSPAEKRKTSRGELAQALRRKLEETRELSVRVRDLSAASRTPNFGYPLDLAVRGPEVGRVREFAKKLAARLKDEKQLTDVWLSSAGEPSRQINLDIDRTAAAVRGVAVDDIFTALQTLGGLYVNDFTRFGRSWQVQVQASPASGEWLKDLRKLKVRGAQGNMIPLTTVVKVREGEAPQVLDFVDFWPMVEITANPASAVRLEDARQRCETLAEEVRKQMHLPRDYRLVWLP